MEKLIKPKRGCCRIADDSAILRSPILCQKTESAQPWTNTTRPKNRKTNSEESAFHGIINYD